MWEACAKWGGVRQAFTKYGAECDTLLQGGVQDSPYALEVRDGVRQACTEWDWVW